MQKFTGTAKVKILAIFISTFGLIVPFSSALANVVITEIMYHPTSYLETEEFVELYNTDSVTVNLENWQVNGISFTFGTGASIGPNAYLVLAKDANQFHAIYGFWPDYVYSGNLKNSGEALQVIDASSNVVDQVTYGDMPPWPVMPDGLGPSLERIVPTLDGDTPRNWRASIAAAKHTAKTINSVNASGLPPWISDVNHGIVRPDSPIIVKATVQDATAVHLEYIINFGTPVVISMLDDGSHGDGAAGDGVYGATIPAQNLNTLVRYRVDANGLTGNMKFPRTDDTVTYTGTVTENDASIITGMPVFHWFMEPVYYNAAYTHMYTDDTEPGLLYYGGKLYDGVQIRIRGSSSRGWLKKNWKFYFPQGHDFYAPGLINGSVDNFDMQAEYSDKTYMRELLTYMMFEDFGSPASQMFYVRSYLNGQFYGMFSYCEHPDDDYFKRWGLDVETGSSYEAKGGGTYYADCHYVTLDQLPLGYEKHRPNDNDYNDLNDLLFGINNLSGQARRNFIFDNIDIPRMLNYLAICCVIHEDDSVAKNYYLYHDVGGTQRWYLFPWDKDLTWGRNYNSGGVLNDTIWADVDSITGRTNVSPSHPLYGNSTHQKYDYLWNRLIDVLYNETDIRQMYLRRLRTVMDEGLQPSSTPYAQRKIEKRIDELTPFLDTEAAMDISIWALWGQYQTVAQAAQILKDSYLTVRRNHLFVTHRVAGEIPEAQTSQPPIVINEIMYNPPGDDANEFIELYNPSSTESVDLTDWRLDGVALTFPPGTVLLPQSYLVVVKNDVQFRATYGSGIYVAAQYKNDLDNGGETLTLMDSQGNVIDKVRYDDDAPWPALPDAGGY
jgi:hypothetical protein